MHLRAPRTAPAYKPPCPIGQPSPTTILLTGGCGYIGSHTAAELLRRTDYRVVLLDNLANSERAVVERIGRAGGRAVEFVRADLRSAARLREKLAKLDRVDAVVHFAALKSVPASLERPTDYYENNVGGMINLLAWMRRRGCRSFVFSSSCAVYGDVGPGAAPVTEVTPLGEAANPYAHSKQLGERLLGLAPDLRAAVLRYFNPAGADDSGLLDDVGGEGLTSVLCRAGARGLPVRVFGDDYPTRDGTCVRDYVHVVDIARAHADALEWSFAEREARREVFNLGAGRGTTVREAIAAFERAAGIELEVRPAPRRPGDVAAIQSHCAKAGEVLGWRAERGLDQIMQSAWRAEVETANGREARSPSAAGRA